MGSIPISEAIIAHNLATSFECCNKFWPYEDLYFILPTYFINSGCNPLIPKSITVLFPTSIISWSISFFVFLTTSSILAGCILPSLTSLCSEILATSLLIESKQERIIASGVSSTIISTPVADSIALIFLPSLPIILPLMSSDSILNTETVLSIASSAPILWIVFKITFFAFSFTVNSASSIFSFAYISASFSASFFRDSIKLSFASFLDRPEITSNCLIWSFLTFSTSFLFFSKEENFNSSSVLLFSRSKFNCSCFFIIESTLDSFDVISLSIIFILSSLENIIFSCSDFNSRNFSFACSILLFFILSPFSFAVSIIFSASFFASLNILKDLFLLTTLIITTPTNKPITPTTTNPNDISIILFLKKNLQKLFYLNSS